MTKNEKERKNNFLDSSSDENSEKEDHLSSFNLFKGVTKGNFNNNNNNLKNQAKEKILILQAKLNKNTTNITQKDILNLPPPKTKLIDKNELIDEEESSFDKKKSLYKNLINPDALIEKKESNLLDLKEKQQDNKIGVLHIEQKDILDKNWETKYIGNLIRKDIYSESKKKEQDESNNKEEESKNAGKKRRRDKKDKDKDENELDEIDEYNNRSKYSRISTSKKYGW